MPGPSYPRKDNGTPVVQWPFADGDHQKWNLEATTGGYYVIRAVHSNKALSVNAESHDNGADIVQWSYTAGKEHQQWRLVQKDNGYFAIQNRNSDLFLSVHGESTDNGTALVQWPGGDGDHQQFRLG
ncbi:RICIN domain-containing protein [Streptomyces sp. G35A]